MPMIRSLLFVPADSEKKLAKSRDIAADALVLDLEDSVMPQNKPLARQMVAQHFASSGIQRERLWVRINDLRSGELLKDLASVVPVKPTGLILPKIRGPEDIQKVALYLEALESEHAVPAGSIRLLVLVTETPEALLRMGEIIRDGAHPRIAGLMWGGEDLSSALGAGDPRNSDGSWRPSYELARTQCLLAAHAMGVEAIDTVYVDFRNSEGLRGACQTSRYDGFTGRVAIHPDQVPVINQAFTPTPDELALARRIVDAFAAGAGAIALDGKMYDIPHLKAAQRLLAAAPERPT
jgi:citrate lyase subunit beta/citryl-CoA lyase